MPEGGGNPRDNPLSQVAVSPPLPDCERTMNRPTCAPRCRNRTPVGGHFVQRGPAVVPIGWPHGSSAGGRVPDQHRGGRPRGCLLYTSDAADEEDSVDLGGR